MKNSNLRNDKKNQYLSEEGYKEHGRQGLKHTERK